MNFKLLLRLSSVLVAIGLVTGKALPDAETTLPPTELTTMEAEARYNEDVVVLEPEPEPISPFLKIHQMLAAVQDMVKETAEKTKLNVELATAKVTNSVKNLFKGSSLKVTDKNPHEPEVVLVSMPASSGYGGGYGVKDEQGYGQYASGY